MTNNNSQPIRQAQGEKGFTMPMVIAIIALVVVVGGIGYFATRTKPSPTVITQTPAGEKTLPDGTMVKPDGTMVKTDGTMVKPDGTMVKPDGTMIKPDGTMVKPTSTNTEKKTDEAPASSGVERMMAKYTGTVLAGTSAPLLDFTKADYDTAVKSDKLVVLYFYAKWCPICKVEFPLAQAAFNELSSDKVIGFRVNYKDDQTDADEVALAREFGVGYQHTKVFVKNGVKILKAPDSWNTIRYLSEIKKVIGN